VWIANCELWIATKCGPQRGGAGGRGEAFISAAPRKGSRACWINVKFLQDLQVQSSPAPAAGPSKRRSTFCSKIGPKTEPPQSLPKVPKRSPKGSPNGTQTRQNPQKLRPGWGLGDVLGKGLENCLESDPRLPPKRSSRSHKTSIFTFCMGSRKVFKLAPKGTLLEGLWEPKSTNMPSKRVS